MDKRKKAYLADHPVNNIPLPTQPYNGNINMPVPTVPGQELDPTPAGL